MTEQESDEEIAKCAEKQEVLAAGEYAEHLTKAKSEKRKEILKHNQKDELEDHAKKLKDFIIEKEAQEATA